MKRFLPHFIASGGVALWTVFSYAYLGVEDGSSGLSFLGWLHGIFFVPGAMALHVLKGAYGSGDLPYMAAISWLLYTLLFVAATHAATLTHRHFGGRNRSRRRGNKKNEAPG